MHRNTGLKKVVQVEMFWSHYMIMLCNVLIMFLFPPKLTQLTEYQ